MNRFYSPLVMNIANSEGMSMIELEKIAGTGNEGRVTKKDILHYVQTGVNMQQAGNMNREHLKRECKKQHRNTSVTCKATC